MKILAILPASIGGRLTMQSIFDGFAQNGFDVFLFDKLKDDEKKLRQLCKEQEFDFLVGYDFAGLKIKVDNELQIKTINYFSDVIEDNHSGNYWQEYYKYLKEDDNYTFYWDKELYLEKKDEISNLFYQPHFVNTEVYKNFNSCPQYDIMFAGRIDTDFRLRSLLELMAHFEDKKFAWYAIEKHFEDAKSRVNNSAERALLEKNYRGFISTEEQMAQAINNAKIFFNFNAQGISSLNYRTFQVMSCERVMFSDDRLEAHTLFSPDNDIVIYNNLDDLKSKIEIYLNNKDLYFETAKAARKSILKNHSSLKSVKNMLDMILFN